LKREAFHSLLTAKTLFGQAEKFCQSSNEHYTSAGVVLLQDAVELFFLACLLEKADGGEDHKLEKASFPEIITKLRQLGVDVAKSVVLNAMNKTRVVVKHYGQVCAPAAAMTYLDAARASVDLAVRQVFGMGITGVMSTALLDNSKGKDHLNIATEAFDRADYSAALVGARQALFAEFEHEYFVGDYRKKTSNVWDTWAFRGKKAPARARSHEFAIQVTDPIDLLVVDIEQLRFDLLEIGASIQDFMNVQNRTPWVVELSPGDWRLGLRDMAEPWAADRSAAEYCLDQVATLIQKKQAHARSLRSYQAPAGKHWQCTLVAASPAFASASRRDPPLCQLLAGQSVWYAQMTYPFEPAGAALAKVFVFDHPSIPLTTAYVDYSAIHRVLVDTPKVPPPPVVAPPPPVVR